MFLINPYQPNPNSKIPLNKDRLTSIDLLQVKKLKEHVYQKILKLNETLNIENVSQNESAKLETTTNSIISNSGSNIGVGNIASTSTASNLSSSSENKQNNNNQQQDQVAVIERMIEIICSEQVSRCN